MVHNSNYSTKTSLTRSVVNPLGSYNSPNEAPMHPKLVALMAPENSLVETTLGHTLVVLAAPVMSHAQTDFVVDALRRDGEQAA